MRRVWAITKPIGCITGDERAELYSLLGVNFLGVSRDAFERDFEEKDSVILLYADEEIVGFSTLKKFDLVVEGWPVNVVFSGDTSVLSQYRNSPYIGSELMRYFLYVLNGASGRPVYYILISKGWRTYRLMPFLFKGFAPAPGKETVSFEEAVLRSFGEYKYPSAYSAEKGLILHTSESQRVKLDSVDADTTRMSDPYISFFLGRNPDFLKGDELVCAARITPENFTPQALRLKRLSERRGSHEKTDPALSR